MDGTAAKSCCLPVTTTVRISQPPYRPYPCIANSLLAAKLAAPSLAPARSLLEAALARGCCIAGQVSTKRLSSSQIPAGLTNRRAQSSSSASATSRRMWRMAQGVQKAVTRQSLVFDPVMLKWARSRLVPMRELSSALDNWRK